MVGRVWCVVVAWLFALSLALPAAAQTKQMMMAGGWAISPIYANGKFVRCVADTTGKDNQGLRISITADLKRHVILPGSGTPKGTKDQATVTLQPANKPFTLNMTQDDVNRMWSGNLNQAFIDALFEAKRMEVRVPSRNITRAYNLGDTEIMTAAMDGCLTSNQAQSPLAPAPSQGMMIYPDFPGASQSCVVPMGMKWTAGTPLVLTNCPQRGSFGFALSGRVVSVADRANLCVGSTKDGSRTIMELQYCAGATSKWAFTAGGTSSGNVQSDDGRCWVVPKLSQDGAKFPFPIETVSCGGSPQPTKFFFEKG